MERVARSNRIDVKKAVGGGIQAGLVGGAAIALFLIVVAVSSGGTVWSVLKGAAAPFLGAQAATPEFALGPVLLGSVLHFAISAAWGAAFGVLAYGLSRGATVVAGLGWGLVVWLVMYYVVLPLAGLGAMVAQTPAVMAILAHLVFGLALGLAFLPFQRRIRTGAITPGERRTVYP